MGARCLSLSFLYGVFGLFLFLYFFLYFFFVFWLCFWHFFGLSFWSFGILWPFVAALKWSPGQGELGEMELSRNSPSSKKGTNGGCLPLFVVFVVCLMFFHCFCCFLSKKKSH